MKPRFLIDVDQVLALFVDRVSPLLEGVLGRKWDWSELPENEWNMFAALNPWQRRVMDALMSQPGFVSGMRPVPGAWEALLQLHELCEVFVVTTPLESLHWIPERTLWLRDKFAIPGDRIIYTHTKYPIAGKFFLDDKPSHVLSWAQEHPEGVAMLWTTDHNRRIKGPADVHRVEGWDAVLEKVRHHA